MEQGRFFFLDDIKGRHKVLLFMIGTLELIYLLEVVEQLMVVHAEFLHLGVPAVDLPIEEGLHRLGLLLISPLQLIEAVLTF